VQVLQPQDPESQRLVDWVEKGVRGPIDIIIVTTVDLHINHFDYPKTTTCLIPNLIDAVILLYLDLML
jgi:hypothetical protein